MTITPDTIANLSPRQKECLGHYAFPGLEPPRIWPKSTLNSLVAKGLLIRHRRQHPSPGMPVMVDDYEVPLDAHMAYCQWCGDEPIESMIEDAMEDKP